MLSRGAVRDIYRGNEETILFFIGNIYIFTNAGYIADVSLVRQIIGNFIFVFIYHVDIRPVCIKALYRLTDYE